MALMETRILSDALGVDIHGLDLRQPLEERATNELKRLLDEYQLLVFRNQDISPEDQIRLLSVFGPVSDEKGDGRFHSFVSNIRPDGLFAEWPLPFHLDYSFRDYQPEVFSLYGVDVESGSAATQFASNVRAARELPPALRARLEGKMVVHADDFTKDAALGYGQRARLLEYPVMPPETTHPRTAHPVLRPHPRTGVPLLFVTEMHTSHIEGMTSAESEAVLAELFEQLYAAENIYAHQWSRGDLVVWDNVALQHGRKYDGERMRLARRTLRRVAVSRRSAREFLAGTAYNRPGGFNKAVGR